MESTCLHETSVAKVAFAFVPWRGSLHAPGDNDRADDQDAEQGQHGPSCQAFQLFVQRERQHYTCCHRNDDGGPVGQKSVPHQAVEDDW